jgi:excisionase family DNA binding protein
MKPNVKVSQDAETLTVNQAHARIGKKNVSRQALYLALMRRELPSVKLGRRILIPRAAFENWLNGDAANSGRAANNQTPKTRKPDALLRWTFSKALEC